MPRAYTYTEAESSQVMEIAYDHPEQAMYVRFRSTPRFRYKYPKTPPEQVTQIMFGESVGSAMRKFTVARGDDFEKIDLAEQKSEPTFN